LVLGAIVLAVPTVVTDILGSSNVSDWPETYYVSPADLRACEWVRTHLPRTAIVQSKPDYIGDYQEGLFLRGNEISLIPAFALRRSALGAEYAARSICAGCKEITILRESDLDTMFRTHDVSVITSIAAKYKIDYLYVGPYEQNQYPTFLSVVTMSPRFEEVYNRDSVHILRIVETKPAAEP
jgi:hypothetical protein